MSTTATSLSNRKAHGNPRQARTTAAPTPAADEQAKEAAARARAAANGEPIPARITEETTARKAAAARTVKSRPVGSAPGTATKKTVKKAERESIRTDGNPSDASDPQDGKVQKRETKRELATRVVEAAAAMVMSELPADFPMSLEEAKSTVAHWLHHLPADRDRWQQAGLPRPDRSDWR